MMNLQLVNRETRETKNGTIRKEQFKTGRYFVTRTTHPIEGGDTWTSITVEKDPEAEYLPPIEYHDDCWAKDPKPCFKIQTMAWGAKEADEMQQIIEGYQEALEAVKLLTKELIK